MFYGLHFISFLWARWLYLLSLFLPILAWSIITLILIVLRATRYYWKELLASPYPDGFFGALEMALVRVRTQPSQMEWGYVPYASCNLTSAAARNHRGTQNNYTLRQRSDQDNTYYIHVPLKHRLRINSGSITSMIRVQWDRGQSTRSCVGAPKFQLAYSQTMH